MIHATKLYLFAWNSVNSRAALASKKRKRSLVEEVKRVARSPVRFRCKRLHRSKREGLSLISHSRLDKQRRPQRKCRTNGQRSLVGPPRNVVNDRAKRGWSNFFSASRCFSNGYKNDGEAPSLTFGQHARCACAVFPDAELSQFWLSYCRHWRFLWILLPLLQQQLLTTTGPLSTLQLKWRNSITTPGISMKHCRSLEKLQSLGSSEEPKKLKLHNLIFASSKPSMISMKLQNWRSWLWIGNPEHFFVIERIAHYRYWFSYLSEHQWNGKSRS